MPKALLLPSYLGGGFGHIGRCLALAAELKKRGWETAFALAGHHTLHVVRAGHQLFCLRRPYQPRPETDEGPAFTVFSDMNYQLVRDGLWHWWIIRACVAEQLKVIRRFQPDLLIADTWPLASILAHLTGLPLVQIIKAVVHSASPNLIWWQAPPAELVSPDPTPVFNHLLESWSLPPIKRAEDLLTGDLYLVPSLPDLEPLPPGLPNTHYVGPLIRPRDSAETIPDWLAELDSSRPVVYVTIGGGAGPVGGPQFYKMLMEALGDTNLQVVASTSAKLSPEVLPPPPPNIRLERWVPGPAVIDRSDLVIFHGGYGTTMELVQAGVPGLIIPFHSEQESNARRLEAAGAARVLLPSQQEPDVVWHRWLGGDFCTLVNPESDLTPTCLRTVILEMLADEGYRTAAKHLQVASQHYQGAPQAVDLIEQLIESKLPKLEHGWDRLHWWQKLSLFW
ncbi:MAG: hypothetical protein JXM69_00920 [Anaerolineae bacterium]|nr:hypothetical protein [Anaerolineae bacterium]